MKGKIDLKLESANLVNLFTSEIYKTDIFINDGIIWGYEGNFEAKRTINYSDKYVTPSFIESHIHIESAHVMPSQFYTHLLKNGVTTAVCDPHEIANVAGIKGIKFLIENSRNLPVDFYFSAPSCVPASSLETIHEVLDYEKLKKLKGLPEVIGLGEVMDFYSVVSQNEDILKKLNLFNDMIIDGHAPGLSGKNLDSYIRAGIYSDHESVKIEEIREKMRKGMYVMIREASSAKNLDLVKFINNKNKERFMLVTDDISPKDLYKSNFILDKLKRAAGKFNIDPLILLKGISQNPAEYFKFDKKGAIVPGYSADLAIFNDLKDFDLDTVIKDGEVVYNKGNLVNDDNKKSLYSSIDNKMNIRDFTESDFKVKNKDNKKIRVIKLIKNNIITDEEIMNMDSQNGFIKNDIKNDIIKISVIERYTGNSKYSTGYIKGTNLKRGAIASSYNHDSHNIVVSGTNDLDMAYAVNKLKEMGGGIIFVKNQNIEVKLPLPIYGIISNEDIKNVAESYENLENKLNENGVKLKNPLSIFSFLALSVIPNLKINDKGLIDVNNFEVIDLYV